jgi:hypothetical protein
MIDTAAMAEFKPHLDIGLLRSPEYSLTLRI